MNLFDYKKLLILMAILLVCGCSSDDEQQEPTEVLDEPRVGFELFQIISQNDIRVWSNGDITREQFDAIELPDNWIKNDPREPDSDSGRFLRSPGAAEDGPLTAEEHFGYTWEYNARILEAGFPVGGQSILEGSTVDKYHEVTFNEGRLMYVLISPEDEIYVRIARSADRTTDIPLVPDTWQTGEYTTSEDLTFVLPAPTLNMRMDNEDTFQGPVTVIPRSEIVNLAFGTSPATEVLEAPIELTKDICEDPNNLAIIAEALQTGTFPTASYGELNQDTLMKMLESPNNALPFIMMNLIHFRDQAVYADGRMTDLTGEQANELYAPTEFLNAIGATILFEGDVTDATAGNLADWDEVGITQYPCPMAFLAMMINPEFQERLVHKDAGVESTIIAVTYPEGFGDPDIIASPFPGTEQDPSFDFVKVFNYFEEAQYSEGADEPMRTGSEAMEVYASETLETKTNLGIYSQIKLRVDGVFIGDGSEWSSLWLDFVPSMQALNSFNSDPVVVAAQYHRDAAVSNEDGLVTQPKQTLIRAPFGRGSRYCELLLAYQNDAGEFIAEVWGTQGLSYCPQESLDALDLDAINEEYNAVLTQINGPRIWLTDQIRNEVESRELRTFGDLLMGNLTSVLVDTSAGGKPEVPPYDETTVLRTSVYVYFKDDYVYELTADNGDTYVMQSLNLEENPDTTIDDLIDLGTQITLPDGWQYNARILTEDLELVTDGNAIVLTDDLGNTYQKVTF